MNSSPSRIAIYSRKSKYTGTGESIENQIELCKDYASRQFGGDATFQVYEDEGFSGKNTDRPEFQQLLRDLREDCFDVLVCYRLDRISRSVSDFSSILDELNDREVAFVSIRENFDTSTPIGRAMIHIASVFAELERETIAERIKDNKYKLYRMGRWQGGKTPLGFSAAKVQGVDESGGKRSHYVLEPVAEELQIVRQMFDKYVELGSIGRIETYFMQNHIQTPGGKEFCKSVIRQILCNPVYCTDDPCVFDFLRTQGVDLANDKEEYDGVHGLIGYGKTVTKGTKNTTRVRASRDGWIVAISQHAGVIDGGKWVQIQRTLLANKDKYPRTDTSHVALLSGLIRCGKCGAPMMVKGNRENAAGEKTFYYKCSRKDRSGGSSCDAKNIGGIEFDKSIVNRMKLLLSKGGEIYESIMRATSEVKTETQDYTKQIKALDERIKQNDDDAATVAQRFARSVSDETDAPIYAALRKYTAENSALKAQRENLIQRNLSVKAEQFNLELVQETVRTFCDMIDTLDMDGKRRSLRLLVKEISLSGDDSEVTLFTEKLTPKKNEQLGNLRCDRSIIHPVRKLPERIPGARRDHERP